ncbi:hypothetical protein [Frischella perrara]|uniref:Uncharacterized protein n=1 Tax=Frischella perrara TaxID=1267021 RepID=A0A318MR16_FRIPE|nr:hypothetical protein [Frischella perrara]PXY95240.1 hypothetical protein DKK76_05520 [Frischella perrara]
MDILKKLVNGKLSLAVTFWIFYFVFRIVTYISSVIGFIIALLGMITVPVIYSIITAIAILEFIMLIVVMIGICNILKNKGVTFWGIAALIICSLNCIAMMYSLFDGYYSYDYFSDVYSIAIYVFKSAN